MFVCDSVTVVGSVHDEYQGACQVAINQGVVLRLNLQATAVVGEAASLKSRQTSLCPASEHGQKCQAMRSLVSNQCAVTFIHADEASRQRLVTNRFLATDDKWQKG